MKILLHACCADCLLKIADGETKTTAYFYNPNIHPRSEYQSRLAAIRKVTEEEKIDLSVPDWRPKEYFEAVKNNKSRCKNCWKLRMERTAKEAKSKGFTGFSTTLLASQYQNQKIIEKIGQEMAEKYEIKFWVPKEIKRELKTSGFYKQFFCGCVYSLRERLEEKYK